MRLARLSVLSLVLSLAGVVHSGHVDAAGRCAQYQQTALNAGWSMRDWSRLSRIMYRESHCDTTQVNLRGRDRSYGLLQINTKGALWGELQRRCGLTDRSQLLEPTVNLRCGKILHRVYGWRPWRL